MFGFLAATFIALHGLVHLWFVTLAQRWVTLKPGIPAPGWSATGGLLASALGDAPARTIATVLYAAAASGLVASGGGLLTRQEWGRSTLIASSFFSGAVILLHWDGRLDHLVDKGALGLLIDAAIVAALLQTGRPAPA